MNSFENVRIMDNAIMCRAIKEDGGYIMPFTTNAFVIRDGKTVFVIDTGAGAKMKELLISAVEELREGADSLVLINTRCHVNRVTNNEYIMNIEGFKNKTHLMHENAKPMLDPYSFYQKLYRDLDKYYDVFEAPPPPWKFLTKLLSFGSREKHFKTYVNKKINKYEPVRMSPGTIQYLKDSDAINISFETCMVDEVNMACDGVSINLGPMQVKGWKVDEAIILQSGGHSLDSIMVYFPAKKLLLAGDLTFEIFPMFLKFSSAERTMEMLGTVQDLVREGLIQIMADSTHYEIYKGATKILDFLHGIWECHENFEQALFSILEEGDTIKSIYRKLRKQRYENPAVDFHIDNQFPKTPVYLKSQICSLLLEKGCHVEGEGSQAVFYAPSAKITVSAVSE